MIEWTEGFMRWALTRMRLIADGTSCAISALARVRIPCPAACLDATSKTVSRSNYFAVSGNFRSLLLVVEQTRRSWYKWLCRRSQRTRLTWERFAHLLRDFPLPEPRILVRIWGP